VAKPQAAHDFGWILLDVALAAALGGDCLAGVGLLRADPVVFGPVAADPTISPAWSTPSPLRTESLRGNPLDTVPSSPLNPPQ
jgi:hypothetical protein